MRITKYNIDRFINGSEMNCSNMIITHIEYIPEGITHLYCQYNKLTELLPMGDSYGIPKLPDSLKYLDCYDNNLYSLPKLSDGLKYLYCQNNELTSLPKLPEFLIHLDCDNNNITSLPKLPESLERLYCFGNKLTELPKLPESLERLNCYNNNNLPYKVTINNFREHNTLLKRKEILSKICV